MLYVNGRSIDEYGMKVLLLCLLLMVVVLMLCCITIPQLSPLLWINWNEVGGVEEAKGFVIVYDWKDL